MADFRIPLPGGMTVEKQVDTDSDSDKEAAAARKRTKLQQKIEEERLQEEAAKKAAEEEAAQREQLMDKEQLLPFLGADLDDGTPAFIAEIGLKRPEGWKDRLKKASDIREKAKAIFQQGNIELASKHWLGAVHCLDFTPRQLEERTKEERISIYEAVTPILCNMAIGARKMNDPDSAVTAANMGLIVVEKIPYAKSKEIRIKLRLQRALSRGEQRNFEGALSEAKHIMELSPGHEEAAIVAKNAEIALRLEKGPKEKRWKGPLTKNIPTKVTKKAPKPGILASILDCPKRNSKELKYGVAFLLPVVVAGACTYSWPPSSILQR